MRLWKRASGAIKDQNSLVLASISRRTELRNPDIKAAVIKATNHDDTNFDYRNCQRVFAWIRISAVYLRPLLWALAKRMEKTRDWVVALKGLMLMHGVFCCKVPAAQRIGRLPFDLSSFKDGHSSPGKTWGYNAFIRAYYAFLDHKSSFICQHTKDTRDLRKKEISCLDHKEGKKQGLQQDLVWLQEMQVMLDMLLQIKPQQDGMVGNLILEAMDCIIIEIFDVYSRICTGIAGVLLKIYSAGKVEAYMALSVLQKATLQGEELTLYFEFCQDIGVMNAAECPKVVQIPEEDIRELEQIISGVSEKSIVCYNDSALEEETPLIAKETNDDHHRHHHERSDSSSSLKTVITDKWEVFEEEPKKTIEANYNMNGYSATGKNNARVNPFVPSLITPNELPDLISF